VAGRGDEPGLAEIGGFRLCLGEGELAVELDQFAGALRHPALQRFVDLSRSSSAALTRSVMSAKVTTMPLSGIRLARTSSTEPSASRSW
jgi:hypothetical protein